MSEKTIKTHFSVLQYNESVNGLLNKRNNGTHTEFFSKRFQVLYCTHAKDFHCGHFHTHIVINSVSYINGQMITTGFEEMNAYCDYVTAVTGQKSCKCQINCIMKREK